MQALRIMGGRPLRGVVTIGGAKNAILPILAAMPLFRGPVTLDGVERYADVLHLLAILRSLGAEVNFDHKARRVTINPRALEGVDLPEEHARAIRASNLLMGPLLSRHGRARIPHAGGCQIGERRIDLHLIGLEAMGADIAIEPWGVQVSVNGRLQGAKIALPFPSVGATENLLMAAVLAEGATVIEGAAREPEIVHLAAFLSAAGAQIQGAGTSRLVINGVDRLRSGLTWSIMPDRIEAGTYALAAVATGGQVRLERVAPVHLRAPLDAIRKMGGGVRQGRTWVEVTAPAAIRPLHVCTGPYPRYPTDLQAPLLTVLTMAQGVSTVAENVFEHRFAHVADLRQMGAEITVENRIATITGVRRLHGAALTARDLRGAAALLLAGLAARGESFLLNYTMLDRGYADWEAKLAALGARLARVARPAHLAASFSD